MPADIKPNRVLGSAHPHCISAYYPSAATPVAHVTAIIVTFGAVSGGAHSLYEQALKLPYR